MQVALPLVLILAIITRLMVIEYTEAMRNQGPRILDMWKQQMILRSDTVMDAWERKAELGAFPDFSRIQWEGIPKDSRFGNLCTKALELNDGQPFRRIFTMQLWHMLRPLKMRKMPPFFTP